jgi:N-acetylneuraminate synthase
MTPLDHPIQWAYLRRGDGALEAALPPEDATRRQDLPEALRPVGFYLCTTPFLREHGRFLVPGLSQGTLVPASRGVDIDAPADLALARHHVASREPRSFALEGRPLGQGRRCFLIAEAGVNHNGDLGRALEMVRVAAEAGADAIKFQTFKSEALASRFAPKAEYQARNTGDQRSQLEMLKELELSAEAFQELKRACDEAGILFLSTPFEEESARFLDELGVAAFKVGSGELTNLPLLRALARSGRPLILSTGMATLEEVADAVEAVRGAGDPPLALLHCVSMYPAPCEEYNLRAMATMEAAFGVPVGLSDHTLGWEATLAAVALGASIIEKHFTLDRSLPGPDHLASLDPQELKEMITQLRRVESAMGDGLKRPTPSEANSRAVGRKSIVAAKALPAGHVLAATDLGVKRPGLGIPPGRLEALVGRRLSRGLEEDQALGWDDLEPEQAPRP